MSDPSDSPTPHLRIIGLTGGIGSGKSATSRVLTELGAILIDADELSREAVKAGTSTLREIVKEFGPNILLEDGELDRKALAKIVFQDSARRKALEDIVHPQVRKLYQEQIDLIKTSETNPLPLVVYVVPLLFESRFAYEDLEMIVVVSASEQTCLKRIVDREKCSTELALQMIRSQLPIAEKARRADYVIQNEGTLDELEKEVKTFWQKLNLACSTKGIDANLENES